jgi:quinol-cytochrome oxidoreductase complex cytochrome b subunit
MISRLLIHHLVIGFMLLFLIACHIIFLHNFCSINNVSYCIDFVYGFNLTLLKDCLFINLLFILFIAIIYFNPILLGNYANIIYVNYFNSPIKIKPE